MSAPAQLIIADLSLLCMTYVENFGRVTTRLQRNRRLSRWVTDGDARATRPSRPGFAGADATGVTCEAPSTR